MHTKISNNKRRRRFLKDIEIKHWHTNYLERTDSESRKNMGTDRTNPRKRGS